MVIKPTFPLLVVLALAIGGCAQAERVALQALDRAEASNRTTYETTQGQTIQFPMASASFADHAADYDNNDSGIEAEASNTSESLGPPTDGETYTSLGGGGSLVLEFTDNTLSDGPGDDLAVFEIGPQVEALFVAVSEDGRTFVELGRVEGSSSTLDIAGRGRQGAQYRFIRLTDDIDDGDRRGRTAGADIDAIGAINGETR